MTDARFQAIHIIGGGLAGAEAAWQIAARGVPVVLHEMRPIAHDGGPQDRRARRARLLELVPLRRPRAQRRRAAACGDATARLADHAGGRCEPGARRRRAGGRSRGLRRRGHGRARRASADRCPSRGDRGIAARGLGQRHRRDRPPHLAGARRRDRQADRRGCARVLRRHRADRPSRLDRHVGRLVPVALRQGRARRIGRRLHQLPAHARAVRGVRRCARRRRQDRLPRLGKHDALFRRLPADRGDGRARARNAAARPDEAVRADQSARADGEALRGRAAAPGQQARHAVQHGRLPDQAQARRADAHLPHHSGSGAGRVRAARRAASQHLPQFAEAARRDAAACRAAAPALCRPDHRLRGLCGIGRDRAARRPLRGGGAAGRADRAAAAHHGARRAARPHHRRPCRDDRCRPALVPADERQFRPVPAARVGPVRGEAGKRLRGTAKTIAKKQALARRALADLEQWHAGDGHAAAAE